MGQRGQVAVVQNRQQTLFSSGGDNGVEEGAGEVRFDKLTVFCDYCQFITILWFMDKNP